MPLACCLHGTRLEASAPYAGSCQPSQASHGAWLDMGAAVAHTFVLLRPLGRRLLGVPHGLGFPGSRSRGFAVVVGLLVPRGRLFAASTFLGRKDHLGPVG